MKRCRQFIIILVDYKDQSLQHFQDRVAKASATMKLI